MEYNEAVYEIYIYLKQAYDSIKREVLCNILNYFGINMKQVRLIKIFECNL